MTTITVCEVKCPRCGASEVANPEAPVLERKLNIRAFKVCDDNGYWWSQCLLCKDRYAAAGIKKYGWF